MSDTDADLTALIADVRANAQAAPGHLRAWAAQRNLSNVPNLVNFDDPADDATRATFAVVHTDERPAADYLGILTAHIARMGPATTLRLVDAVERLTRERDDARAENERLRGLTARLDDERLDRKAAASRLLNERRTAEAEVADLRTRLADAEATIQRVRDLAEKLRGVVGSPEPRAWSRWAAERIDAALDGPQDGGEGR